MDDKGHAMLRLRGYRILILLAELIRPKDTEAPVECMSVYARMPADKPAVLGLMIRQSCGGLKLKPSWR